MTATGLALVLVGCGSGANHSALTTNASTTVPQPAKDSALSFREVHGTIPYGTLTAATGRTGTEHSSCEGGRLVTAPAKQAPDAQITLADRTKSFCYVLGPTLLVGTSVASADAVLNTTSSQWQVDVHFANNDFVEKVASVEIGKQIAIILDGVVQSAPIVQQGITGTNVTITGPYDEATARDVAARIDPSSRSRTPTTPATTLIDTFDRRCDAIRQHVNAGQRSGTSEISAATARQALERAGQPVPAWLAALDGSEVLARCDFSSTTPTTSPPTTICPSGDPADVGAALPDIMYAADANLDSVKLPGLKYLLPPGMTVPTTPGPCAGLGAPP